MYSTHDSAHDQVHKCNNYTKPVHWKYNFHFSFKMTFSGGINTRKMDRGGGGVEWSVYSGGSKNREKEQCRFKSGRKTQKTYYSAESLSWYSRARLKHSCTPESFHKRFIMDASSVDISPSSALPASERNCRASSYQQTTDALRKSPLCEQSA